MNGVQRRKLAKGLSWRPKTCRSRKGSAAPSVPRAQELLELRRLEREGERAGRDKLYVACIENHEDIGVIASGLCLAHDIFAEAGGRDRILVAIHRHLTDTK